MTGSSDATARVWRLADGAAAPSGSHEATDRTVFDAGQQVCADIVRGHHGAGVAVDG